MSVELKINKLLTGRVSDYELNVKYMHGDADAYTTETWYFPEKELSRLKQYLQVADALSELDDDGDVLEVEGLEEDVVEKIREDLYRGDATCDGCRSAAISGIELFYYDAGGRKFDVEFTVTK